MLTDENKAICAVLMAAMSNDPIPALSFEKAYFSALIWHFNEKRSWSDESIKKQAIKVEIEKLEKLVNGNANDQDSNYYLNQFNQYLYYNLSENNVLQAELMRSLKEGEIKFTFKHLRLFFKESIFQKKYKSPQSFFNAVEKEANDLGKIGSPEISKRLNKILSGYKEKYDERTEPFYKSLLQFKDYLTNYGKSGTELAETRFKSNMDIEEIEAYFSKLTNINSTEPKYKGKLILSKEELTTFLHSNFRNFNPSCYKEMINANCSNATLIRFIYEFYELESRIEPTRASLFHKMLKDNFQNFSSTELKTIRKEFSRVRPVHFPFH